MPQSASADRNAGALKGLCYAIEWRAVDVFVNKSESQG
jgi:hypothetical protein